MEDLLDELQAQLELAKRIDRLNARNDELRAEIAVLEREEAEYDNRFGFLGIIGILFFILVFAMILVLIVLHEIAAQWGAVPLFLLSVSSVILAILPFPSTTEKNDPLPTQ